MRYHSLSRCRGLSLMELVAASVLGVVIILALGQVDVARVQLYEENIRMGRRTTDPSRGESEAGFALKRLMEDIKQADRVVLRDLQDVTDEQGDTRQVSNRIQIRKPVEGADTLADLNNLASYSWLQYRLDAPNHQVLFYKDLVAAYDPDSSRVVQVPANCTTPVAHFRDVDNLEMRYLHVAQPALGGDPFPNEEDNNVLEIVLSSQMEPTVPRNMLEGSVTPSKRIESRGSPSTSLRVEAPSLTLEDIRGRRQFKFGAATMPAVAYANVDAGCFVQAGTGERFCDSGSGLAPQSKLLPCP